MRKCAPHPTGRGGLGGGATNGQAGHFHGGLADADRDALAVFAAGADAGVLGGGVADHFDFGVGVGAVADEGGAFDGGGDFAVFDQVGFGG